MKAAGKETPIVQMLEVGPIEACCYLFGDPSTQQAAVIDPGADGARIIEAIEGLQLVPVLIINTHGHYDHIGANSDLKLRYSEAPLCVHSLDETMLTRPSRNMSLFLGGAFKSVAADRMLEEGDELSVGGLTLKVFHTPGHTPGGISLYCPEAKCCFTGDSLFAGGIGRSDFPGSDGAALLESIRGKILTLDLKGDSFRAIWLRASQ